MTGLITDTLVTGLPFVPVFLGVYLVLRLRQDFDLTVEGSFAVGGSACAMTMAGGGGPVLGLLVGAAAGAAAGAVTALLHLTLDIPVVLAGLVMSIGLFSVALRVTHLPTVSLLGQATIFTEVQDAIGMGPDTVTVALLALIVAVVLLGFGYFLLTEVGLALRASGVNETMVRSQGASDRGLLVLSLMMSNALAGFGAGLAVQVQGYADVNMGAGTFVAGVGAVLLGVLLFRPDGSQIARILLAVLVGTLAYRLILVGALRLGVPAGDLKGITALTLIIAVAGQRYLGAAIGRLARLQRRPAVTRLQEGALS